MIELFTFSLSISLCSLDSYLFQTELSEHGLTCDGDEEMVSLYSLFNILKFALFRLLLLQFCLINYL